MMEFGKSLREKEFMMKPGAVFLNHGAYGTVPKCVFEEQISQRRLMESHPDRFYRCLNIQSYKENLMALCDFIGTKPESTVLLENVTTAMNTVMNSLKLGPSDVILTTSLVYNAVRVMCGAYCGDPGPKLQCVNLSLPLTKEKILKSYAEYLDSHQEITLAILDHISSSAAIKMPIKELVDMCRERNILTLVDGAHVCGQLPVNIETIGADFYGGNVHKWMFTPRGCGYLWINPKHRQKIRPLLVSHFHGSQLHHDFCIRGTRDDTPYHCIKTAIQFYNRLGGTEAIHSYVENLLKQGVDLLTESWGTQKMDVTEDLEAPFMKVIGLPELPNYDKTTLDAGNLEAELYEKYNIQTQCRVEQGSLVIRISAHVYNCMEDFELLDKAVLELQHEAKRDKKEQTGTTKDQDSFFKHWDLTPFDEFASLNID